MTITRPQPEEYGDFYAGYIEQVTGDAHHTLENGVLTIEAMFSDLTPQQLTTPHIVGEWTIQEVLMHIIDTERVFAYRLLRIARGDHTPMPGFDQDMFVDNSHANQRDFESLLNEYAAVRQATLTLLEQLNEEELARVGQASGFPLSARAAAYILAGHEQHHITSLRENYL